MKKTFTHKIFFIYIQKYPINTLNEVLPKNRVNTSQIIMQVTVCPYVGYNLSYKIFI